MGSFINKNHCKQILLSINKNFEFTSFEVRQIECKTGHIGRYYTLKITYKNNKKTESKQFFIKTPCSATTGLYQISKELKFFEKERFVYTTLFPAYVSFGIDVNFCPKSFCCEDEFICLEDLSIAGFKVAAADQPLDMKFCHSCLNTLANFHASSIIYEISKSQETSSEYSIMNDHHDILQDVIYSGSIKEALIVIQKTIEFFIRVADEIFGKDSDVEQFKAIFSSEDLLKGNDFSGMHCTVLHADLWANNFLHKYEEGNVVETKLVDYQNVTYGPPAMDVLRFMYSNTRKNFRIDHFNEITEYYYKKLKEILTEKEIDINDYLPAEEYFTSCEELKIAAKIQSTLDRTLTCVPTEVFASVSNDKTAFENFYFKHRASCLIDMFHKVTNFRDILLEDLQEIKEMISTGQT